MPASFLNQISDLLIRAAATASTDIAGSESGAPHIMLDCRNMNNVSLYTNYAHTIRMDAHILAQYFNDEANAYAASLMNPTPQSSIHAETRGDIIRFRIDPELINQKLIAYTDSFDVNKLIIKDVTPDISDYDYWLYVASVILREYKPIKCEPVNNIVNDGSNAFLNGMALTTLYLALSDRNNAAHARTLIRNMSLWLQHAVYTQLCPYERLVLTAAVQYLTPQ